MKNKKMLFLTLSAIAFVTLTACNTNEEQTASNNNEAESNSVSVNDKSTNQPETDAVNHETGKDEEKAVSEEQSTNGEKDNSTEKTPAAENDSDEKTSAAAEDNKQISSGDDAVQFLKEHLKDGKNEDVSFGTDGELLTDASGSYYMVQLVDVPLRGSGKTGNLGYYQVYQNGVYKEFQSSVETNSENTAAKDDYLKKLNALDEADRNAEVKSTTAEMIEQEDERFKAWDNELNAIYATLQEQLSADEMDKLREAQRTWITNRDNSAYEASLAYEGGTMQPLEAIATKASLTRERCYELVASYM